MCAHPMGPFAEVLRFVERVVGRPLTAADPEFTAFSRTVWALRLSSNDVFDLTFDSAPVVGLTHTELVGDDYSACQVAGERYGRRDPEFPKVWRYASSALPGTENYVVFGARAVSSYHLSPIGPAEIPGAAIAVGARPPGELLAVMRHVGDAHAGVVAYLAGSVYEFEAQPTEVAVR
jgi:hypothetical protein